MVADRDHLVVARQDFAEAGLLGRVQLAGLGGAYLGAQRLGLPVGGGAGLVEGLGGRLRARVGELLDGGAALVLQVVRVLVHGGAEAAVAAADLELGPHHRW